MTCQKIVAFSESSLRLPLARGLVLSVGICLLATGVKFAIGNGIGEGAPFALFGTTLVLAGRIGGTSSLFVVAPLLAGAWWYFFSLPKSILHAESIWHSTQLISLLTEGVVILLILRQIESSYETLRTKHSRASVLRELADCFVEGTSPQRVAIVLIQKMAAALGARRGIIVKPEVGGSFGVLQPQPSDPNECDVRVCQAESLPPQVLHAFESGEPSWSSKDDVRDNGNALSPLGMDALLSTILALPLKTGSGRTLGVLVLEFTSSLASRRADASWLAELGRGCAQVIEQAALVADTRSTRLQLEELGRLGSALGPSSTVDEVARIIVKHSTAAAGAQTCALYLCTADSSELELVASDGIESGVHGESGRIAARGVPPYSAVGDVDSRNVVPFDERRAFPPVESALSSECLGAQATWNVPLISEGRRIGMLALGFAAVRRCTGTERLFLEIFAGHCADALCRASRGDTERQTHALTNRIRSSMQAALWSIGDAVMGTDSTGKVTFMNPTAEGLTGWSAAEAEGRPSGEIVRVVDETSGVRLESPVPRLLRGDVAVDVTTNVLLVSRDGTRITPVEASGTAIRNEDGSRQGVVMILRDNTVKRDNDSMLRLLSEVTRTLDESLDYQVTLARVARLAIPAIADWVAVDLLEEGKVEASRLVAVSVNSTKSGVVLDSGATSTAVGDSSWGVTNVLRTGRAEVYEDVSWNLDSERQGGEALHGVPGRHEIRSLMIVPLIARSEVLGAITFAILDSGRQYGRADLAFAKELCWHCAMAIDQARLRSAVQRASRNAELANLARDEFLATVSHELRTPLNAIMGWARLLSSPELDSGRRRRGVETIERNSVAMARLIEDTLDVSRIISGKMRLELKVVNLPEVIEAAIDAVRPAAQAKSVTITAELDHACCPILGDPARIQQVIWNLLSNAVKFNTNDGRVDVDLRRGETAIEIRVADTGRGIHPSFLPYVFDPFRQAESGYARGRSGLGLGLAIARQLTELHGGVIDVASDGEGRGATFCVRLPIPAISRAGESNGSTGHRRIASQPRFQSLNILRGLRVLVVDDDEDARFLVKTVLEQCGSVVRMSASVTDGMSEIARDCPALVISDIGMPGEDGYDLIRRIRNSGDPRVARLPAAALTAFVRAEDRQRMLRAGYGIHIPKPVEPAELVAAIARLLRTSTKDGSSTDIDANDPI